MYTVVVPDSDIRVGPNGRYTSACAAVPDRLPTLVNAPAPGSVGRVADVVDAHPITLVVVVVAAGSVHITPDTSQSPAVRLMVVMSAFVAVVRAGPAPWATDALMYSPTFPAAVLSFVAVPTIPPVVGLNVSDDAVAAPMDGVVSVGDVSVLFVSVSVVLRATRVSVDVGSVRVPVLDMVLMMGAVRVLLVSVSVVVRATRVSVDVGRVIVPVFDMVLMMGAVSVLLVSVSVDVRETSVLVVDGRVMVGLAVDDGNTVVCWTPFCITSPRVPSVIRKPVPITWPEQLTWGVLRLPVITMPPDAVVPVRVAALRVLFVSVSRVLRPTSWSLVLGSCMIGSDVKPQNN